MVDIDTLANELVSLHGRNRHAEMIDTLLLVSKDDADKVLNRIERWGYHHVATPALRKALESARQLRVWNAEQGLL